MSSYKYSSFKIAYSSVISALSVMVMFVSIIPGFTYALPAISGMLLWTIGEQISMKWGILSFAATSVLAIILVPEIEAVSFFIAFFGYYPLLREKLKAVEPPPLRLLIKFTVFNITAVGTFQIVSRIIGLDKMLEGMEFMGEYAVLGLWGLANIAFLCYDFCLEQMFYLFRKMLKPILNKRMK